MPKDKPIYLSCNSWHKTTLLRSTITCTILTVWHSLRLDSYQYKCNYCNSILSLYFPAKVLYFILSLFLLHKTCYNNSVYSWAVSPTDATHNRPDEADFWWHQLEKQHSYTIPHVVTCQLGFNHYISSTGMTLTYWQEPFLALCAVPWT